MFYDVESQDLEELWDSYGSSPSSYVTALHQDILMSKEEEWNNSVLYVQNDVVLRDRLMTDAALGGPRPIKSEHSYSLLVSSPPPSPTMPGGSPHTPNASSSAGMVDSTTASTAACIDFTHLHHKSLELLRSKIDEMEEEYFPTISMNTTSNRGEPSSSFTSSSTSTVILKRNNLIPEDSEDCPEIKDEPISEPPSPCVPCQPVEMVDDKSTITMMSPQSLHYANTRLPHTSDSEEEDEECDMSTEIADSNLLDEGKETILHTSRQGLPPTPPSSASSDSEGTASASCSPERRDSQTSTHVQNLKGLLAQSRLFVSSNAHTTRQPIHTPLISCQPKGSTGMLTLTDEEKKTLIAEGYPVPTKLPLSKQEEKSLKKIRRKIKNKISAQESRRKKKEYMDTLERRVTQLATENSSYKNRLSTLEDINRGLLKEVQRLQTLLHHQGS